MGLTRTPPRMTSKPIHEPKPSSPSMTMARAPSPSKLTNQAAQLNQPAQKRSLSQELDPFKKKPKLIHSPPSIHSTSETTSTIQGLPTISTPANRSSSDHPTTLPSQLDDLHPSIHPSLTIPSSSSIPIPNIHQTTIPHPIPRSNPTQPSPSKLPLIVPSIQTNHHPSPTIHPTPPTHSTRHPLAPSHRSTSSSRSQHSPPLRANPQPRPFEPKAPSSQQPSLDPTTGSRQDARPRDGPEIGNQVTSPTPSSIVINPSGPPSFTPDERLIPTTQSTQSPVPTDLPQIAPEQAIEDHSNLPSKPNDPPFIRPRSLPPPPSPPKPAPNRSSSPPDQRKGPSNKLSKLNSERKQTSKSTRVFPSSPKAQPVDLSKIKNLSSLQVFTSRNSIVTECDTSRDSNVTTFTCNTQYFEQRINELETIIQLMENERLEKELEGQADHHRQLWSQAWSQGGKLDKLFNIQEQERALRVESSNHSFEWQIALKSTELMDLENQLAIEDLKYRDLISRLDDDERQQGSREQMLTSELERLRSSNVEWAQIGQNFESLIEIERREKEEIQSRLELELRQSKLEPNFEINNLKYQLTKANNRSELLEEQLQEYIDRSKTLESQLISQNASHSKLKRDLDLAECRIKSLSDQISDLNLALSEQHKGEGINQRALSHDLLNLRSVLTEKDVEIANLNYRLAQALQSISPLPPEPAGLETLPKKKRTRKKVTPPPPPPVLVQHPSSNLIEATDQAATNSIQDEEVLTEPSVGNEILEDDPVRQITSDRWVSIGAVAKKITRSARNTTAAAPGQAARKKKVRGESNREDSRPRQAGSNHEEEGMMQLREGDTDLEGNQQARQSLPATKMAGKGGQSKPPDAQKEIQPSPVNGSPEVKERLEQNGKSSRPQRGKRLKPHLPTETGPNDGDHDPPKLVEKEISSSSAPAHSRRNKQVGRNEEPGRLSPVRDNSNQAIAADEREDDEESGIQQIAQQDEGTDGEEVQVHDQQANNHQETKSKELHQPDETLEELADRLSRSPSTSSLVTRKKKKFNGDKKPSRKNGRAKGVAHDDNAEERTNQKGSTTKKRHGDSKNKGKHKVVNEAEEDQNHPEEQDEQTEKVTDLEKPKKQGRVKTSDGSDIKKKKKKNTSTKAIDRKEDQKEDESHSQKEEEVIDDLQDGSPETTVTTKKKRKIFNLKKTKLDWMNDGENEHNMLGLPPQLSPVKSRSSTNVGKNHQRQSSKNILPISLLKP